MAFRQLVIPYCLQLAVDIHRRLAVRIYINKAAGKILQLVGVTLLQLRLNLNLKIVARCAVRCCTDILGRSELACAAHANRRFCISKAKGHIQLLDNIIHSIEILAALAKDASVLQRRANRICQRIVDRNLIAHSVGNLLRCSVKTVVNALQILAVQTVHSVGCNGNIASLQLAVNLYVGLGEGRNIENLDHITVAVMRCLSAHQHITGSVQLGTLSDIHLRLHGIFQAIRI